MSRSAVVTGGGGFIGSHLTELLVDKKYQVKVLDNFNSGSLKNLEKVAGKIEIINQDIKGNLTGIFDGVDFVFHLAGIADIVPSINNPSDYFATNVQGTINVLEHSRKSGVGKFVYAASASCYGMLGDVPFLETTNSAPEYPYALSKLLGEQCVMHWHKVYRLPVVSLRLFNVYGERSRSNSSYGAVLGVFLTQLVHGYPLTIIGDGSQSRDFVHVTDVARAFVMAAESNASGEIINIGGGKPIPIKYLANLISSNQIQIPKRPGEPDVTWASIEKAEKILGWEPSVIFEEEISKLILEKENWRTAPLWTVKKIENQSQDWYRYLGKENA